MIEELLALQGRIHQMNVGKGFWQDKENRNKGEAVMLMICELSEAVESHRKPIREMLPIEDLRILFSVDHDGDVEQESRYFTHQYNNFVKGSIEEELADVTIRLLDYCAGFGIKLKTLDLSKKQSVENFAGDALRLCYWIIEAFHTETGLLETAYTSDSWSNALSVICRFCEWYNIDLLQHVQWKMKYNSLRPYLHGKKY